MPKILACDVPVNTFLRRYQDAEGDARGFADCYQCEVDGIVTQEAFIEAFYTSPLFKIERMLLTVLAARPADDTDARRLAKGDAELFSAWRVESQSGSELLLADFTGRTRSWLMAMPMEGGGEANNAQAHKMRPTRTRLYFGSAVLPLRKKATARVGAAKESGGNPAMGRAFHALLGFHRLYSRLLLSAASKRARAHGARDA